MTTAAPSHPETATHSVPASPTRIEWLGLRLDLPHRWEIVRHSTSPRKGSLVFADRTRQRLQLTWTACSRRPDVARLLADHQARQREQSPDQKLALNTPLLPVGWRGMQRTDDSNRHLIRTARYDAKTSRLIEVVLDTDTNDPDDAGLIHNLLNNLAVTDRAEDARRFRAFGLEVTAPEDFQLITTAIQPADAALIFSTRPEPREPDKHPSLTVRRRAMADVWFDGHLEKLLQQNQPRAAMQFTDHEALLPSLAAEAGDPVLLPSLEGGAGGGGSGACERAKLIGFRHPPPTPPSREGSQSANVPHNSVSATWNVPGPRAHRLLNLHRVAVARAWLCPADNAVYEVLAVAPAKRPPSLDALRLVCGQGGCVA